MGLFDKVKNLFTDEIEDEVKTGMIQVEIPAPVQPKEEEKIADTPVIKQEEKPTAPIFFDDDYFKELEQPKPEVKSSYRKEPSKPSEKKIFKPTPIISPVYGVLDKNYHKEEITSKPNHRETEQVTVDDIRKKAFGTLEDELETTLFGNNSILFSSEVKETVKPEDDLFEEMTKEDTIDVNLDEKIDNPVDNIVFDEMEKDTESTVESELFDLIDSMYEKGE